MNQMYQPHVTTPTEVAEPGQVSTPTPPQQSSQDLFARLSSIQLRLWKCRDHSKTNSIDGDASTQPEIDRFIQTASDIYSTAETAAVWSQDSTVSREMSSHDRESFYFQLMVSVSTALEILAPIVNLPSVPASDDEEQGRKSKTQSFIQMKSSFFNLTSLKDNDCLNTRLTFTTIDFYLI